MKRAIVVSNPGVALALIGVLAVSACATTQAEPAQGTPFEGGARSEEVLLTVENNEFRDATIDVYWNGMRTRAGIVPGKSTKTFTMRWRSEWAQIGVGFLGGGGYQSERIPVDPGDHLNYTIMVGT